MGVAVYNVLLVLNGIFVLNPEQLGVWHKSCIGNIN
nr:MAG TPA: hypothetical protein [Caudoviricetes sp.]DAQ84113.1 MAG TPA: hypothetical protein [Caudoviricetes sp.]